MDLLSDSKEKQNKLGSKTSGHGGINLGKSIGGGSSFKDEDDDKSNDDEESKGDDDEDNSDSDDGQSLYRPTVIAKS